MEKTTRLNKAMSMIGICSRREADKHIQLNNVMLNGKIVENIGTKICEGDKITFNKKSYIFHEKLATRVWLYYKPVGLITSNRDEHNRKTIFDDLKTKISQRVISIGRLDLNSQGLLLLTNDGEFSRYAESPKTGWTRHYMVRVFGNIQISSFQKLEHGITIDNVTYGPLKIISLQETKAKNCWINCSLTEGKNREIRNIFQHLDLQVNRLIRYKYGPYELGDMQPGEVEEAIPRKG